MVTVFWRASPGTTLQKDLSIQMLLPEDLFREEMMMVLVVLISETCFQGKMIMSRELVTFFLGHLVMSDQSLIRASCQYNEQVRTLYI